MHNPFQTIGNEREARLLLRHLETGPGDSYSGREKIDLSKEAQDTHLKDYQNTLQDTIRQHMGSYHRHLERIREQVPLIEHEEKKAQVLVSHINAIERLTQGLLTVNQHQYAALAQRIESLIRDMEQSIDERLRQEDAPLPFDRYDERVAREWHESLLKDGRVVAFLHHGYYYMDVPKEWIWYFGSAFDAKGTPGYQQGKRIRFRLRGELPSEVTFVTARALESSEVKMQETVTASVQRVADGREIHFVFEKQNLRQLAGTPDEQAVVQEHLRRLEQLPQERLTDEELTTSHGFMFDQTRKALVKALEGKFYTYTIVCERGDDSKPNFRIEQGDMTASFGRETRQRQSMDAARAKEAEQLGRETPVDSFVAEARGAMDGLRDILLQYQPPLDGTRSKVTPFLEAAKKEFSKAMDGLRKKLLDYPLRTIVDNKDENIGYQLAQLDKEQWKIFDVTPPDGDWGMKQFDVAGDSSALSHARYVLRWKFDGTVDISRLTGALPPLRVQDAIRPEEPAEVKRIVLESPKKDNEVPVSIAGQALAVNTRTGAVRFTAAEGTKTSADAFLAEQGVRIAIDHGTCTIILLKPQTLAIGEYVDRNNRKQLARETTAVSLQQATETVRKAIEDAWKDSEKRDKWLTVNGSFHEYSLTDGGKTLLRRPSSQRERLERLEADGRWTRLGEVPSVLIVELKEKLWTPFRRIIEARLKNPVLTEEQRALIRLRLDGIRVETIMIERMSDGKYIILYRNPSLASILNMQELPDNLKGTDFVRGLIPPYLPLQLTDVGFNADNKGIVASAPLSAEDLGKHVDTAVAALRPESSADAVAERMENR